MFQRGEVRGNKLRVLSGRYSRIILPECDFIEEETYQLVHKAVEQLPKQSCKIIQLSLQGYSNQEIADQLNISINSVRTLKQSAYKKLRGILKEHFYLLPLMLKMNFF